MSGKRILIIAGPNGAGKTTFAKEFLPREAGCFAFVNADLIAAGLSPFRPDIVAIRAGRLMLREIEGHVKNGNTFAFESTLAGRGYVPLFRQWRSLGYRIKIYFLGLDSVDQAIGRVRERVSQGGHHIPEDVIRRRYDSGLKNFQTLYRNEVHHWLLYDNSGDGPILVDVGANDL